MFYSYPEEYKIIDCYLFNVINVLTRDKRKAVFKKKKRSLKEWMR